MPSVLPKGPKSKGAQQPLLTRHIVKLTSLRDKQPIWSTGWGIINEKIKELDKDERYIREY